MYSAVQLELGSTRPANNTVVVITTIGNDLSSDGGDPLLCTTQRTACCASSGQRHGEWVYPNGINVPIEGTGQSFYRKRRDSGPGGVLGAVLLHRRFDAMEPTGIYHCILPGADGMDQALHVGLYTSSTNGSTHE